MGIVTQILNSRRGAKMKQEKNKIKWTKKGLIRGTWQTVKMLK